MGSKATTPTFNFDLTTIFFYLPHSVCGKKPKTNEIRGQMIKNVFFGSVPNSPIQIGLLSAKNASKNFSRLGTFNSTSEDALLNIQYTKYVKL
jgi:hypothetical protein